MRRALLLMALLAGARTAGAQPAASFQKDVEPILRTACLGCHSGPSPSGGYAVTSFAALFKSSRGPLIVPGKSAQSRLVRLLNGAQKPQMPPTGMLRAADIERIALWIDSGAKNDATLPGNAVARTSARVSAPTIRRDARPLGSLLPRSTPVNALAYSPDGALLAVGTYQKVLLCDPKTRAVLVVWKGHADTVRALAFTPDGRTLLAGGGSPGAFGEVRLWRVAENREVGSLGEQADTINALAVSPDGTLLATGSADKTVQVWDLAARKRLQTLREHADSVLGVAFRTDGKVLATAGADKTIKIWDTVSWRRLYTIGAHDEPVDALVFTPSGQLLSAGADRVAKVWDIGPEGGSLARALGGHTHAVWAVAVSGDGQWGATGSADKTVRLWNVGSGALTATLSDAKDWVYTVRLRPDGQQVVAGTWDGQVLFWNAATGALEGALDVPK
jgi:hypothetical protein